MMTRLKLGHVHLKVRDLQRALDFYTRILGLRITEEVQCVFAFLSSSELHHEIALQQLGEGAPASPPGAVGLYHVAFEVADKPGLAQMYHSLREHGVDVVAVDHRISWALYFSDPDGNGLEVYTDTRHQPGGAPNWQGRTRHLRTEELLQHLG